LTNIDVNAIKSDRQKFIPVF